PFPFCKNITGDITDPCAVKRILSKNYDVVINCIGVLNEACDRNPSRAIYINSYLPHFIAEQLKNTHTKLIHLSTDCVFSGKSPPYIESSFRDGEKFYDRTKALGEVVDTKNLTFRNSLIGPDMNSKGIGLFNWFMKQEGSINGYTSAIWTGVTTLTLAKAVERAACEKVTGIYNLVNNTNISKFDLLKLMNEKFKENKLNILPFDSVKVDKTLLNNRADFSFIVPSYKQMIEEMKVWIYTHKEIYPHYFS
ncbi:MAG TPA: sugar nucleotide-binding protein, partial [Metabacillus sp.]|nr:sugar nucleotide-binding protein [Metabacillus sp.]